ncbi:hypothetical protein HRG_014881 [Hirsutella rhossiliensis]
MAIWSKYTVKKDHPASQLPAKGAYREEWANAQSHPPRASLFFLSSVRNSGSAARPNEEGGNDSGHTEEVTHAALPAAPFQQADTHVHIKKQAALTPIIPTNWERRSTGVSYYAMRIVFYLGGEASVEDIATQASAAHIQLTSMIPTIPIDSTMHFPIRHEQGFARADMVTSKSAAHAMTHCVFKIGFRRHTPLGKSQWVGSGVVRASIYVGITTLTVPDTPTVSAYHSNVLDFLKCHIILKAINRSKNAFRSLNVSILREQLDVTRIASSRDLETVRDLSTHRAQYDCYLLPIPHFCLRGATVFATTRLRVGPRINVLPDDLSHPFNLDSVILYCGLFGVVPTTCLTSILEPFSLDQVKLHYSAAANFFAPRTRRKLPTQSYARIERPQFNPQNPARARPDPSTTPAPSSPPTGEDTIICAPPGHPDCESDDDMPDADTSEPPLNSTGSHMTLAEKARLIKKWADNKQKHVRKKRDKNSHVYWYMQREAIDRSFYSEDKDGPKIFQEFRWTCIECLQNPSTLRKIFQVLESNRRGVTSGMGDHLKSHSITKESHHGRINGYGRAIGGGDYTEVDAWSGRPRQRARLTAKESIRQWFTPAFQEMFLAHNTTYFVERREKLKIELQYNCATISLTLDIWTAPNRCLFSPLLRTGLRRIEKTLEELRLKPKLLAITGDNAANNGTLYYLKTRPHSNFRASW